MIVMTKYNSTKTRSSILGTGQISTVILLENHQVKIIEQENDITSSSRMNTTCQRATTVKKIYASRLYQGTNFQ